MLKNKDRHHAKSEVKLAAIFPKGSSPESRLMKTCKVSSEQASENNLSPEKESKHGIAAIQTRRQKTHRTLPGICHHKSSSCSMSLRPRELPACCIMANHVWEPITHISNTMTNDFAKPTTHTPPNHGVCYHKRWSRTHKKLGVQNT